MLTAGGFVATEDLVMWQVVASALGGAVIGDQIGYRIGTIGGHRLLTRFAASPSRAALIARSIEQLTRRGALGIFLTRWLFTTVGPWANLAAGAIGLNYWTFTLCSVAGETVWVGLYVALGYSFAGNIQAASDMMGSVVGILAGISAMLVFGYWLYVTWRQPTQP